MQSLAEKLKKGMGTWSDFDDAPAAGPDGGSKRQRDKKKVKIPVGAATARPSAPAAGSGKAPGSPAEYKCRVEVSRNGRGGKTGVAVFAARLQGVGCARAAWEGRQRCLPTCLVRLPLVCVDTAACWDSHGH